MWYGLVGIPALYVGMLYLTARAARRFEAREQQLGRWDQYGPLDETEGPADALPAASPYNPRPATFRAATGNMEERLEVTGQWHGKVLRHRERGQKPDAS